MKKLFISQPMQGKSKEEILAERKSAICQAKEAVGDEVEIIDSYFENAPVCNRPLWFLGESLKLLHLPSSSLYRNGSGSLPLSSVHAPGRSSSASGTSAAASFRLSAKYILST